MQTQQNTRIQTNFKRIAHYATADITPCGAHTKATQYAVQRRVLHETSLPDYDTLADQILPKFQIKQQICAHELT